MVRNESVRFGRHIDIEVSYKILQLQVPKLVPILNYPACFQKGLFGGSIEQKHPSSFRGYCKGNEGVSRRPSTLQTCQHYP
jgi:hypothetical protein